MAKKKLKPGEYVISPTLTFGTLLRAHRLCFTYVPRLNAFIRITNLNTHFLVELRPNSLSLLNGGEGEWHCRITEPEKSIAMSPVLSAIAEVKEPIDLYLDDDGLEVAITTEKRKGKSK